MLRLIAVMMLALSGTTIHATDLDPWGVAGDWAILVDPDAGNGCLARRQFDSGLTIEVGAVPNQTGGFFAAYSPEWSTIEEGAVGVVSFDFGDAKFAGDVVGFVREGIPGGYAFFDNPEFVSEFGKRHSVIVSGENNTQIEVDLSGSTKAIEAVLACQAEQPASSAD